MPKKGFEKSIHVVITIVVALVIALAVITLVLNAIKGADQTPTQNEASCNTWKLVACGPGDTGTKTHPNIAGCEIDCGSK